MVLKFVLYLFAFFLFIAAISYSDSVVSASIRVSATVEQPLGLSSFSLVDLENQKIGNSILGVENDSDIQLLLRIPHNQSAICVIETADGKQFYYSVSEDLLPVASINDESGFIPAINQITVIYTEN